MAAIEERAHHTEAREESVMRILTAKAHVGLARSDWWIWKSFLGGQFAREQRGVRSRSRIAR